MSGACFSEGRGWKALRLDCAALKAPLRSTRRYVRCNRKFAAGALEVGSLFITVHSPFKPEN